MREYLKNLKNVLQLITIAGSLLIFSSTSLAAASGSPLDMLKSTSDQMLSELNVNKTNMKSDPGKVFDIVNRILLPHVDMPYMSKAVVGRSTWNAASASTQQAFIGQFTNLLIKTYASALASYSNQTVQFSKPRENYEGKTQFQIYSEIIQPGGPPIPVSYRLLLENHQWKVIDFSVDNVSIIENYRAQFSNDLSQHGLENLVNKLAKHNRSNT